MWIDELLLINKIFIRVDTRIRILLDNKKYLDLESDQD